MMGGRKPRVFANEFSPQEGPFHDSAEHERIPAAGRDKDVAIGRAGRGPLGIGEQPAHEHHRNLRNRTSARHGSGRTDHYRREGSYRWLERRSECSRKAPRAAGTWHHGQVETQTPRGGDNPASWMLWARCTQDGSVSRTHNSRGVAVNCRGACCMTASPRRPSEVLSMVGRHPA